MPVLPVLCGLQVQQQPSGVLTYQQHFQRTAGAMAVPALAVLLHWLAAFWMDLQQRRDTRKLQRLEATQKTMLKELKVPLAADAPCVLACGDPVGDEGSDSCPGFIQLCRRRALQLQA
jgi:hypothetical protein